MGTILGTLKSRPEYAGLDDNAALERAWGVYGGEFPDFETFKRQVTTDPYGLPPAPAPQEERGEFGKGFGAGAQQIKSSFGGTLEAIGQLAGAEDMQAFGRGLRETADQTIAENYAPKVAKVEDAVKSPGQFMDWLLYQAGNLAPSMAASATGAITGAAAGTALGGPVGGVVGGAVGGGGVSWLLNAGEYAGALQEQGTPAPMAALMAGIPAAALDAILPMKIAGKVVWMSLREAEKKGLTTAAEVSLAKRWAKEAGKDTLTEGATETGQEVIGAGLESYYGEKPFWTPENASRFLNSFAAGAVGGAAVGAGTGWMKDAEGPTPPRIGTENEPGPALLALPKPTATVTPEGEVSMAGAPSPPPPLALPPSETLALPAPGSGPTIKVTEEGVAIPENLSKVPGFVPLLDNLEFLRSTQAKAFLPRVKMGGVTQEILDGFAEIERRRGRSVPKDWIINSLSRLKPGQIISLKQATDRYIQKLKELMPKEYDPTPREEIERIEESAGSGAFLRHASYADHVKEARELKMDPLVSNEQEFLDAREAELLQYVEEPVQPMVRRIWAAGGSPVSSNAYGPGWRGVQYIDAAGKPQFEELNEKDATILRSPVKAKDAPPPEAVALPEPKSNRIKHKIKVDPQMEPGSERPVGYGGATRLSGVFSTRDPQEIKDAKANGEYLLGVKKDGTHKFVQGRAPYAKPYLEMSPKQQAFHQAYKDWAAGWVPSLADSSRGPNNEWVRRFLVYLEEKLGAPPTREDFLRISNAPIVLKEFSDQLLEGENANKKSNWVNGMRSFILSLRTREGASPTASNQLQTLSDLIGAMKVDSAEGGTREGITHREAIALINEIGQLKTLGTREKEAYRAISVLMYNMGRRIGELAGIANSFGQVKQGPITWRDIFVGETRGHFINFPISKAKPGQTPKMITVQVLPVTKHFLDQFRASQEKAIKDAGLDLNIWDVPIFSIVKGGKLQPITEAKVNAVYEQAGKNIGLKVKFTSHLWRHTNEHSSVLGEDGAERLLLKHSKGKAKRAYNPSADQGAALELERLHPLAKMSPEDFTFPTPTASLKLEETTEQGEHITLEQARKVVEHLIGPNRADVHMFADGASLAAFARKLGFHVPWDGTKVKMAAFYDDERTIAVAEQREGSDAEVQNLIHESFHFVYKWLLTPRERNILLNPATFKQMEAYVAAHIDPAVMKARLQDTPDSYANEIITTAIEYYSVEYLTPSLSNTVKAIFRKIIRFFERLLSIKMINQTSWQDIARDFLNGHMASRSVRENSMVAVESANEFLKLQDNEFTEWFGHSVVVRRDGSPRSVWLNTGWKNLSDELLWQYPLKTNSTSDYNMPAFVRLERPFHVENLLGKMSDRTKGVPYLVAEKLKRNGAVNEIGFKTLMKGDARANVSKFLKRLGYDGILLETNGDITGMIPLEKDQVRRLLNTKLEVADVADTVKESMFRLEKGTLFNNIRSLNNFQRWLTTLRHRAAHHYGLNLVYHALDRYRARRASNVAEAISGGPQGERLGAIGRATVEQQRNVWRMFRLAEARMAHPDVEGNRFYIDTVGGKRLYLTPEETIIYSNTAAGLRYLAEEIEASFRARNSKILSDVGLPEGAPIAAIRTIGEKLTAFPAEREQSQGKNLLEYAGQLQEFADMIERPYIPHVRFGDWAFAFWGPNDELLWFEKVETNGRGRSSKELAKRMAVVEGDLIKEGKTIVRKGNFRPTYKDYKDRGLLNSEVLRNLDFIAGLLADSQPGEYSTLIKDIRDIVGRKGFKAHLMKRSNVPGYTSDIRRATAHYMVGAANMAAYLRHGFEIEDALAVVDKTGEVETSKYARDAVEYMMAPQEEHAFLRMLGFNMFIGGSPASAILQMTTLFTFALPYLSQFSGKNKFLATSELTKASKDVFKIIRKSLGHRVSTGEKFHEELMPFVMSVIEKELGEDGVVLSRAWAEGHLRPIYNLELSGLSVEKRIVGGMNQFQKTFNVYLPAMFNMAEVAGRMINFLAAYRMAKRPDVMSNVNSVMANNKLWTGFTAANDRAPTSYDFAKFATDDVFSVFGKMNRAGFMRGFGAAIFQFSQYPLSMIELMFRIAKLHGVQGKKAALAMSLNLMIMGGIWGLPAFEDLKEILERMWLWAFGTDINFDLEFRELAKSITGTNWAGELLSRGAWRAMGIDISRRVSLGNLPPMDIVKSFMGIRDISDLLGVPGSMIVGTAQNVTERIHTTGNVFEALAREVPFVAARNVAEAVYWGAQGPETRRGEKLTDREGVPLDLSTAEVIGKGLGFAPARVTQSREAQFYQQREAGAVDTLQANYYTRLAREMIRLRAANREGDVETAEARRQDIVKIYKEIAKYNKGAEDSRQVEIDRAYLRRKTAELESGRTRGPVKTRETLRDIKELQP